MATLAHNLTSRMNSVKARYPGITIYWIGDPAHQAETSDHNPDSRAIVHALDFMTYTNTTRGNEIVAWLLSDPRDLEYVIFNRTIWPRSNGFKAKAYTGSNPHTDHVHASGKHGSVGENAATGTGYDVVAEQMTPEGMNMASQFNAEDLVLLRAAPWQYNGNGMPGVPQGKSTLWVLGTVYSTLMLLAEKSDTVTPEELEAIKSAAEAGTMAAIDDIVSAVTAAVIAALPEGTLTEAEVESIVRGVFADAGTAD